MEVMRVSTGKTYYSDQWNFYVSFSSVLMKDSKLHENLNLIGIKDVQSALEWAKKLGYGSPIKNYFPDDKTRSRIHWYSY
jgi:hypothetical protein